MIFDAVIQGKVINVSYAGMFGKKGIRVASVLLLLSFWSAIGILFFVNLECKLSGNSNVKIIPTKTKTKKWPLWRIKRSCKKWMNYDSVRTVSYY